MGITQPSISLSFTERGMTALTRGERGIIAMILKDDAELESKLVTMASVVDIPSELTETNKEQIRLAFKGYQSTPKKVIAYVLKTTAEDYTEALTAFESVKFDYLVVPTVGTDKKTEDIVAYVKSQRQSDKLIKAILPNTNADTEGIINFATEKLYADDKEYDTEEYCSRIAGIIAGTPLNISATYAPLPELTDCTHLLKEAMDEAANTGKFIVFFDGEKVKTGRAVNSFVTTTEVKGDQFRKIKKVDVMDMIQNDIKVTAEDNYIGKYTNNYDNKCLLIAAISNYFDGLIADNILSSASVEIDIKKNASYLRENKKKVNGKDVDSMSSDEIKRADTGSNVFLMATINILDAIEDIYIPIAI